MATTQDHWAQWVLQRRFGGDEEYMKKCLVDLYAWRDRVIENARLANGETLLDVGAGDGLIAFGALPKVGGDGKVILSEISQDLLDHCEALANRMGATDRCQFLRASAEDLSALGDGSVDVVTTRAVLIYVADKQQAFHEFYRVLRAGGRISLFEPINSYFGCPPPDVYDQTPVGDIAAKLRGVYDKSQEAGAKFMLDFDDHDLMALAERAGFAETHMELHVESKPVQPFPWETFLRSSPNPLFPTAEEAMSRVLTAGEIERYTSYMRPLVEKGIGKWRMAIAYIWATKR